MPGYEKKTEMADPWKFTAYKTNPEKPLAEIAYEKRCQYFVGRSRIFRTGQGFGNMMHMVFSRIVTWEDVDPVDQ